MVVGLKRPAPGRAGLAFAGLLVFVVLVYSNPGTLFFAEGGQAGMAKTAAGFGLGGLGLAWLLRDRRLVLGGAVGALLVGYYSTVGVSASWSLWPSMTMSTFTDGLKYLAIYFLAANVVDTTRRATVLVHVIAFSSAIPAIGAINGWAHGEYLVDGDRAAWIGIFGNPNELAYYLVVGLALALGGRELARGRALRVGYLAAMAVMATAILLTQSRGGLLSAGVVIGLWALRNLRRGRALVGVVALVALALWIGPDATWQRAGTSFDYGEDASAQGRIDAWRTGVNVMKGRPFTGVGAGAFPLAWAEFAPGDAGAPRTAHNTFVQVGAETGLPSFLLFVGAVAAALIGLGSGTRADRAQAPAPSSSVPGGDSRHALAVLTRTAQVALTGFISSSLTGGLAYSWPLYLLLGLSAALIRVERVGDAEAPSSVRSPAVAARLQNLSEA